MAPRLLVANRGEIARRVLRACRKLGVETVAVHSEADAGLAHVAEADRAVEIGPAPARDSYLKIEALIAAAKESGATLVHPGYGFLSENADFARAVTEAGLTWVGPAPELIRALGDKAEARGLAEAAQVPVLPGSPPLAEGAAALEATAAEVGFPLLVKAAGGGGGIGMRRVDAPGDLAKTVEATRALAARAFGNGAVFLERLIPRARHVEVQVFGFGDGRAVHCFERDCSLQRRFQKVVEESPAPGLPEAVAGSMAEAAVRLAEATRYAGAGTVEFLVDCETLEFFFLEMNTRIQVEHPVTEMVTGLDLVAWQIQHALGDFPGIAQAEIGRRGAAVECRLYAERPEKLFLPSPGPLERFELPEETADLRIETGYRAGDLVTPHYDPLLAKVVAWGETREAARARAAEALRTLRIAGPRSNRDFLVACLEHPAFAAGEVHTGFIESHLKALTAPGALAPAGAGC